MLRDFEVSFSVGNVECVLMDLMDEYSDTGASRYYQHCHPAFEMHYISNGFFEVSSGRKLIRVGAGELLIVPPGVYHYVTTVSENASRMSLSVNMLLSEEYGCSSGSRRFYQCFPKEHSICVAVSDTPVQDALEMLRKLAKKFDKSFISVEKLRICIALMMVNLFELLSANEKADIIVQKPISSIQEFTIDTFFGSRFMQNNSNRDLARELNVSPRQLHRIMKKAYGMNYREKLKQIRMEIATDFLINSDKSVGEIAELIGYSSSANFSAFVKRETGKSPLQIRTEERRRLGV